MLQITIRRKRINPESANDVGIFSTFTKEENIMKNKHQCYIKVVIFKVGRHKAGEWSGMSQYENSSVTTYIIKKQNRKAVNYILKNCPFPFYFDLISLRIMLYE